MMMVGGNQRLKEFFQSKGVLNHSEKEWSWKWRIRAAVFYRETIKA
jgi:hypothetical protein